MKTPSSQPSTRRDLSGQVTPLNEQKDARAEYKNGHEETKVGARYRGRGEGYEAGEKREEWGGEGGRGGVGVEKGGGEEWG